MARDEIEEAALRAWSKGPEGGYVEGFRAGYVAALRRAEKMCLSWADDHLEAARVKLAEDGLAGSAAEHECAAAIGRMMAERIASLLPKEPGDGDGRGG